MDKNHKQENIDGVYKSLGYILGLMKDPNWADDGSSVHLCAALSSHLHEHFEELCKYYPNHTELS